MPPLSVGVYSPSMVHILLKTTSGCFPRVVAFKIRKHYGGLQTLTGGFAVPSKTLQRHCYEFEKLRDALDEKIDDAVKWTRCPF